jgi:hypothetical protein
MKAGLQLFILATLVAGCSPAPTAAPQPKKEQAKAPVAHGVSSNQPFYLYRGMQTLPGTSGVDWSRNSFGVSGRPAALALFDSPVLAGQPPSPCVVRIAVTLSGPMPPAPGTSGLIQAPNPNRSLAAIPGPWIAVFDNNPVGHWSIPKGAMVGLTESNNKAAAVAGWTFQQMADTGAVTVLDGTMRNCHA